MNEDLKLGELVRFNERLERVWDDDADAKVWRRSALPRPREGVFVGWRNQQNGYTNYDYEDGHTWVSTGTVRCALVATHPWRNPEPVPPGAVERVELVTGASGVDARQLVLPLE